MPPSFFGLKFFFSYGKQSLGNPAVSTAGEFLGAWQQQIA